MWDSVADASSTLASHGYFAGQELATSVFLALRMGRPLFLEGAPGVGKTELAKVVASVSGAELVRLQCHEGLDLAQAVYEWNYSRQLLALQSGEVDAAKGVFTSDYLLRRPLLAAIESSADQPVVLLIDEIDRADEEFESFLLELLSDFQVSIPELGTIVAAHRPIVVLTSNRTREVHDALKRRCIYHYIDYPSFDEEVSIVCSKLPQVAEALCRRVVAFVQRLRTSDLYKAPGVAETIDWAEALSHLGTEELDETTVVATAGLVVKVQDDLARIRDGLATQILDAVKE